MLRQPERRPRLATARAGLGIAVVQQPISLADVLLRSAQPACKIGKLHTWIVKHENLREMPHVSAVFDHLAGVFDNVLGLPMIGNVVSISELAERRCSAKLRGIPTMLDLK